ncbi:MAG TPA: tetratricopeptide repeat protein, partial [Candidatus Wallbacteria bacterium]|nr:tetratricopeptide repeat protein [Candidatus Wallbacteria bacterium]
MAVGFFFAALILSACLSWSYSLAAPAVKSEADNLSGRAASGEKPGVKAVKKAAGTSRSTAEVDIKASVKKFYTSTLAGEKRERFKKIISGYRKDKKKAGPSYSLFVIGLVKELAEDYKDAIEAYNKLIKLYPKAKYANLSKERISECYLAMGERDRAVENYQDYYKWRISEGKREQIIFKIAEIYNQTLTTLEKITEAYKMAASRYEFSKNETVEYLVGYFKGFHLLDAHLATLYYRRVLKEYPDGLYKFDALMNMSLIFA